MHHGRDDRAVPGGDDGHYAHRFLGDDAAVGAIVAHLVRVEGPDQAGVVPEVPDRGGDLDRPAHPQRAAEFAGDQQGRTLESLLQQVCGLLDDRCPLRSGLAPPGAFVEGPAGRGHST
jgi:hypothetical protein